MAEFIVVLGAIIETFIIFFFAVLVLLAFYKYLQLKNRLTLLLCLFLLSIFLAVFFSWLSKILVIFTDVDYLYNEPTKSYPHTPVYLIHLRIVDFRIALAFIALGAVFSYIFKENVFEEEHKTISKVLFYSFANFTIFFSIFIYERGDTLLDALNFLFVFTIITIVYLPFMIKSIKSYRSSDNPFIKKKLLSLSLMSLTLMTVMFLFLIDRILVLLGAYHFTVFYFIAWIFVMIGIICAYIGYIMPKTSEE